MGHSVTQGPRLIAAIAVITLRVAARCHSGRRGLEGLTLLVMCLFCSTVLAESSPAAPPNSWGGAEAESAGLSCVQKAEGQDIWEEHMND